MKPVSMLGSCFLSPELSSCQHHWLKINSVFKCDSFPQAFHKCKPDRFEEERELFLPQSGVLPIHCWRGRKKKKRQLKILKNVLEFVPSCLPVSTPNSLPAIPPGALRSTLLFPLRGLLSPPPLNASSRDKLTTQALATPGPCGSVKTWATPVSKGGSKGALGPQS